jgi:hypothetical protein
MRPNCRREDIKIDLREVDEICYKPEDRGFDSR